MTGASLVVPARKGGQSVCLRYHSVQGVERSVPGGGRSHLGPCVLHFGGHCGLTYGSWQLWSHLGSVRVALMAFGTIHWPVGVSRCLSWRPRREYIHAQNLRSGLPLAVLMSQSDPKPCTEPYNGPQIEGHRSIRLSTYQSTGSAASSLSCFLWLS